MLNFQWIPAFAGMTFFVGLVLGLGGGGAPTPKKKKWPVIAGLTRNLF